MSSFFDKIEEQKGRNKIFLSIIIALILVNLLAFKAIISIASNKTIVIQVPQFLESGEYVIGNTFANNNVYKMWGRVWFQNIGNFSYKNVRKRADGIIPFLDPQTAFENKSKILKFVDFVETNFITQDFEIIDIFIEDLPNGYKKLTAQGFIKRTIGKKNDNLNGLPFSYELILFVRNGQIFINSIVSFLSDPADPNTRKKLIKIDSVNYKELVEDASVMRKDPRKLKRDRLREQEIKRKAAKAKDIKERKERLREKGLLNEDKK